MCNGKTGFVGDFIIGRIPHKFKMIFFGGAFDKHVQANESGRSVIRMEIVNAFATHPGKRSEDKEKPNEDYAHAWEKNGVYFQAVADGNGRTDALNSAPFLINEVHQLSKDHTEAQRLCDAGKITKEQIFTHSDRDILFSALGFDNPEIEIRNGRVKKGDIIMLLTDGAHKLINPSQLNEIVISAGNCYDTCTAIIEASNMLGGPDNIAVCVTYIPD